MKKSCERRGKAGTRFRRRCATTTRGSSTLSNKGARELGFADTGAMWRAKYDMTPDEFTKELDRLWDQVRPLYLKLHAYTSPEAAREVRRHRAGERSDSSAPARQHLGAGLDEHLPAGRAAARRPGLLAHRHPEEAQDAAARHGARRRALLHVARLRAAAQDLLGTIAVHPAAGSRRRVPRQRLGHRPRRRHPHQDVHRADGRGLHDDPSRARAQLLPARLQDPAGAVPRQRQRRVPRGDRRHHRAVGDAGVPGEDRPARQGAGRVARSSGC